MSIIPTQVQFNIEHDYPVEYGEDGDIVVGLQYSREEAFEKFKEYWLDTDGEVPEWLTIDEVVEVHLGWSVHPDYREDEDNKSYCLLTSTSKVTPRYMGWGVLA